MIKNLPRHPTSGAVVGKIGPGILTIEELLDETFVVAKYQRGYKWKSHHVRQLLDDIKYYRPPVEKGFYCLQPLVVSAIADTGREGCWELIDGQQRITTIFLVLACLDRECKEASAVAAVGGRETYHLRYDTRDGSAAFLEGLRAAVILSGPRWKDSFATDPADYNVDDQHFADACTAIQTWLGELDREGGMTRAGFLDRLLSRVAVIWQEARGGDPEKIFLNLNAGKIELTNAERIKALFLQPHAHPGSEEESRVSQTELAQEWDRIEYALREDAFWLFLRPNDGKFAENRIDFLFDLLPREEVLAGIPNFSDDRRGPDDRFRTFRLYETLADRKLLDVRAQWQKIKASCLTLREWHDDPELYHDIGFLIAGEIDGEASVKGLYRLSLAKRRTEFKREVTAKVAAFLAGVVRERPGSFSLADLSYSEHGEAGRWTIQRVLLLFNIRCLTKKGAGVKDRETPRLPFEFYKKSAWSLEHIHAQRSRELGPDAEWEYWTIAFRRRLRLATHESHRQFAAALAASLQSKPLSGEPDLERATLKKQAAELEDVLPEEEDGDGLNNLALLAGWQNSSLGNKPFDEKRGQIIVWDKDGEFVPLATRHVFLKYYGGDTDHMNRWTRTDGKAYLKQVEDTLRLDLPSAAPAP